MQYQEEAALMQIVRANRHSAEALSRVLRVRMNREIDALIRADIEDVPVRQALVLVYQSLLGELQEKGE
jgi:hypothetical protein